MWESLLSQKPYCSGIIPPHNSQCDKDYSLYILQPMIVQTGMIILQRHLSRAPVAEARINPESVNTNYKTWIWQKYQKQTNRQDKTTVFTIVKVTEKAEKRHFNLAGL